MFTSIPLLFDIAKKLLQGTRVIDLPWDHSSAPPVINTEGSSPSPPLRTPPAVLIASDVGTSAGLSIPQIPAGTSLEVAQTQLALLVPQITLARHQVQTLEAMQYQYQVYIVHLSTQQGGDNVGVGDSDGAEDANSGGAQ